MNAAAIAKALKKIKGIKSVKVGTYNRCVEEIVIETDDGEIIKLQSDYDFGMEVPHIKIGHSFAT